MKIGLIDIDGKLPNLALMKISSFYKSNGCSVEFVQSGKEYEKIFASAIFTRSYSDCSKLQDYYVGFDTTFEEDMYRFRKLDELGIRPYVMRYNEKKDDERLNKFTRWVDSMIYKSVPDFEKYEPWKKIKDNYQSQICLF